MKAENYISPWDSESPRGFNSGLLDPWTTEPIDDEIISSVPAKTQKRQKNQECLADRGFDILPYAERAMEGGRARHRWGVVLAGGDGTRLRELTQWVYGDDRPKQFCSLLSNRTLLEDAWLRAERSIPRDQILFCLTRAHQHHYRRRFLGRPSQRIVQPSNKGTAPAILCAMARIARADPEAIVAVLPSDHYYSSETAFTAALNSAMEIAKQRTGAVVVLSAQPTRAETEYGWIEIGASLPGYSGLFHVEGFQEKPSRQRARFLLRKGALWNTFVMAGSVEAFLEMAWAAAPRLMEGIESIDFYARPGSEMQISESAYNQIPFMDFSRHVLAPARRSLIAFRLENCEWNDLGNPYRVLATLVEKDGDLPSWARLWPGNRAGQGAFGAAA
ncbi:MAG TPA: sugar phosphate nucleotidyltransferase [Bryobacteraceae bacterium]|nr:sugar phosphate nucleotidyltransferase [Bryobacteraceae bacterium]